MTTLSHTLTFALPFFFPSFFLKFKTKEREQSQKECTGTVSLQKIISTSNGHTLAHCQKQQYIKLKINVSLIYQLPRSSLKHTLINTSIPTHIHARAHARVKHIYILHTYVHSLTQSHTHTHTHTHTEQKRWVSAPTMFTLLQRKFIANSWQGYTLLSNSMQHC